MLNKLLEKYKIVLSTTFFDHQMMHLLLELLLGNIFEDLVHQITQLRYLQHKLLFNQMSKQKPVVIIDLSFSLLRNGIVSLDQIDL